MRVIGGYLKGQKILEPTDKSTRPLKDRVRESIFNIIEHSNNETVNDITKKLNKILEKMIMTNPEQWIWTHNRWKI